MHDARARPEPAVPDRHSPVVRRQGLVREGRLGCGSWTLALVPPAERHQLVALRRVVRMTLDLRAACGERRTGRSPGGAARASAASATRWRPERVPARVVWHDGPEDGALFEVRSGPDSWSLVEPPTG